MKFRQYIKPLPVGLDIGQSELRAVQLSFDGKTLAVRRALCVPVPDDVQAQFQADPASAPRLLERQLRHLMKQGDFGTRDVVLSIPRSMVQIKSVRLPLMPEADLEKVVGFEAKELLALGDADMQIDFLPAAEVRQGNDHKQEVIVAAAPKASLDAYVEMLHAAGLRPVALDLEPVALYRTAARFVRRKSDEQNAYAILDIGARHSQLVVGRGSELLFYKQLDLGSSMLTNAVARSLGVSDEDAHTLRRRTAEVGASNDTVATALNDGIRPLIEELARELTMCLRYCAVTFRGSRAEALQLVGREGRDPMVISLLGSALGMKVEPAAPIVNADLSAIPEADRHTPGRWTRAFGLALCTLPPALPAVHSGRSRTAEEAIAQWTVAPQHRPQEQEATHA